MRRNSSFISQGALLLSAIALICIASGSAAWGQIIVPPFDLLPLNQSAIPQPPNLYQYVENETVATQLGKAFFWDMQVGSDGIMACATCHFHAGADNRMKNSVNPGTRAGDTTFQVTGPNGTLLPSDFPFHLRGGSAEFQTDPVIRNFNDVVGSQGVRLADFIDIVPGSAVDDMVPVYDPVFNVNGVNTRRVTARNTPTVINAIFNFYQFWDGRAHYIFNGETPFGPTDPNAGVWFNDPVEGLVKKPVQLLFGSIASQATGPPLDDIEMSARGRTFPHLGRKLLSLVPLGKQVVSHDDSLLGGLARSAFIPGATGLHTGYEQLIKEAFHNHLWDSDQLVTMALPNGRTAQFTQMEANFAFFWGLAIQWYMSTLVSDQTPFDEWLGGNSAAMTDEQKQGFALFSGIAGCTICHGGIELTNASVANSGFINNDVHFLIDLMFVADGTQVIYDTGFNNTAVTPTTEDIARGGTAPFINPLTGQFYPLSVSHMSELSASHLLPFPAPILPPGVPANMQLNANGAFKVAGLRNVELTAPFFHNGSIMDMDDMMDFLIRGGNFPLENIHDLDPDIGSGIPFMVGNEPMEHAIIEFMKSLTDPRVIIQAAPFDHPELLVPEGDPEVLRRIPATDSNGVPVPSQVLTINAFITPTMSPDQTLSGTVEAGLVPEVTVNTSAAAGPVAVNGIEWSVLISNMPAGVNEVTVSVTDNSGVLTSLTDTIYVILNDPPSITSVPVVAVDEGDNYLYQVSASDPNEGDELAFSLDTAPADMTIDGVTGLIEWPVPFFGQTGTHPVSVRVTDAGGLSATQTFSITVMPLLHAPVITSSPVTTALAGQLYAYQVKASDLNPADLLTYSFDASPSGMTINSATGLIQWTPTLSQAVTHPVFVRVTDSSGLFSTQSFTISVGVSAFSNISGTVTDRNNAPMPGVTMTLIGKVNKTVTTDPSGGYIFTGLPIGTYEVIPSRTGYRFNPVSKDVTINGVNRVQNFKGGSRSR